MADEPEADYSSQVKEAEDLLKLTRELKELWLAGPLRGIGEGERDGDMADNAKKVQELIDGITRKAREIGVGQRR
jgi:Surfeit locus protein 5 subunit 22 of Mediator complex